MLHDAIEELFSTVWFHLEPITSEKPFTKIVCSEKGSSDYDYEGIMKNLSYKNFSKVLWGTKISAPR